MFGAGSCGPGWGNGKAAAVTYARAGATVVAIDVNLDAAEETRSIIAGEGGRVEAAMCDVTKSLQVSTLVDDVARRHGRVDVLHNNVGGTALGGVVEESEESFRHILNLNLVSAFLTSKYALPHMLRQGKGAIVNVSSLASIRYLYPYASYQASKAGLNQLTQSMAIQYAKQGIRANAILPGFMDTPITAQVSGQYESAEAMRAARAAKTPPGQPAEGTPDPLRITRQLREEGVTRIALVSDDPARWTGRADLAQGVEVFHRDALDAVQREFREIPAVTAIVYEQTCAAEKRRRRKRGTMPDPDRRLYINPAVCEGCGDCSVQSNCIAVEPLDTPLGRKRAINQNACNKDFSCTKGFCPSFVELEGAILRKPDADALQARASALLAQVPEPDVPSLDQPFNVYVTGIGGSGVLTMGALLGAAANADGRAATVLDFTGLAQKNGAVVSQVRLATSADAIPASRIGEGAVNLLLGADLVVSASADTLTRLSPDRTAAVVNLTVQPTADAVQNRDATLPVGLMQERVRQRCLASAWHGLDASGAAQRLFGDTLPMHTLLLGFAWQKGLVPLSRASIDGAIVANGAAVSLNRRAFDWGRILAAGFEIDAITATPGAADVAPETLDEVIAHRAGELTAYQNAAYAQRYRDLVTLARRAEAAARPGSEDFAMAVAVNAYRLMAYKDEYEVARLYSGDVFRASLDTQFASARKVSLWLAPPLLSRTDPTTGRPRKRRFGPWIFRVMRVLACLRGLRGTAADVFGYTAERRAERALVAQYLCDIETLATRLFDRYEVALEVARSPQQIRGFGPVKEAALRSHRMQRDELMQQLTA
ncbi:SDR family NAD(P)-dependent oxidoreductase [Paraburkholderia sp. EG304]|uniref:SDR family NAD(P)-dependent oxidoreductase n=1 Tax=Paraburkholderia sp. EG304 TaxID=3237015 RepID=UPI0039790D9D